VENQTIIRRKIAGLGRRNTPIGNRAVVREVPDTLNKCVRAYSPRQTVELDLARRQHEAYCRALQQRRLELIRIPADNSFPDCVFVEDPAIVYEDNAVVCNMGAKSRAGEIEQVEKALTRHLKKVTRIKPPATIEGGDVLRLGNELVVGLTSRTNIEGVNQLRVALKNEDCKITTVKVDNILHFKSACSYIGDDYIVVNPGYFDLGVFTSFKLICLPRKEAYAANCLAINGTVLISKGYPRTKKLVENEGFSIEELDVSEFKKCEGSLTCLSIIF
jgi:dimethylargininase